jgi:hypothetical protein
MAPAPMLAFHVCRSGCCRRFLHVELEFVVIRNGTIRMYESVLVVVEAFPKCCQVLNGVVPLCVVCFLEFLFCLHVEGAPGTSDC